jgi:hypothetical protein
MILEILLPFFVILLVIAGGIYYVTRRAMEMKELIAHGTPIDAKIVSKRSVPSTRGTSRQEKFVYSYTARDGKTYENTVVVPYEVYQRYAIGESFPIYYSMKRPSVSAVAYLVESFKQK